MAFAAEPGQLVTEACAFCAIVAGHGDAATVAWSGRSLAFCDLRQPHADPLDMHLLVVPQRHVATLDGLDADEAADLMQLAVRVAATLRRLRGDDALTLWQSNGAAAFQEVPHLHLHLLPRRRDDGLVRIYPRGVPRPASRGALEQRAARLRAALAAP